MAKLNDKDQSIYDSYMSDMSKHDPESFKFLSGKDQAWAFEQLKHEPDFNDFAKAVYGPPNDAAAWEKQNPIKSAINTASDLTQPLRDGISKTFGVLNKAYDLMPPTPDKMLSDQLFKGAKGLNGITDSMSRGLEDRADSVDVGGAFKHPAEINNTGLYRATSYALGLAKLPEDPSQLGQMIVGGEALGFAGSHLPGIIDDMGSKLSSEHGGTANLLSKSNGLEINALPKVAGNIPQSDTMMSKSLSVPELPGGNINLQDTGNTNKLSVPQFPTNEKTVFNPESGKIERVNVTDAKALAQSNQLLKPGEHTALSQQEVSDLHESAKRSTDNLWDNAKNLIGKDKNLDVPADPLVSAVKSIDASVLQSPAFMSSTLKKIIDTVNPARLVDAEPGAQPLAPPTMKLGEAVDLAQSMSQVEGSNFKNPVGHFAGVVKDAIRGMLKEHGPEEAVTAYQKAIDATAERHSTFGNDTIIQKFLKSPSTKASAMIASDPKFVDQLQAAGGDAAVEHIKRAEAAKMMQKIAHNDWDGNDVHAHLYKNEGLDALFSRGDGLTGDRLAEIADKRTAQIAHNDAISQMEDANKDNGIFDKKSDAKTKAEAESAQKAIEESRKNLLETMRTQVSNSQVEAYSQKFKNQQAEAARISSLKAQKLATELSTKQRIINSVKNLASKYTGGLIDAPAREPIAHIDDIINK